MSQVQMWEIGKRAIAPADALQLSKLYGIEFKDLVESR